MAKIYSIEHIGKIYNVEPVKVKEWLDGSSEFPASHNFKFAKSLGMKAKSLSGKKRSKKSPKEVFNKDLRKELELKEKLRLQEKELFWNENFKKIGNFRVRESAEALVADLLLFAKNDQNLQSKINKHYNELPLTKDYLESNCIKKHFTWHDIKFVEKGLKVDPNVCFLFIPINGPTRILQDLQAEYFQKKYNKKVYKLYFNKETGKAELLYSEDINNIKSIVENHIHSVKRVRSNNHSKPINNNTSSLYHTSDSPRLISIKDIIKDFPHNQYIQMVAKLIRKNGKALALWENNNGIQEESLLIILRHTIFSFVIWENINDKRACYIFKFKSGNFEQNLNNLINFIASEIHNKRESLFRHADIREHKIIVEDYRSIIHENPKSYKEALNTFISPHFKI